MFKIESSIPAAPRQNEVSIRYKIRTTLEKMKPGQSFAIPDADTGVNRSRIYNAAKAAGLKVTIRAIEGSNMVSVWLVGPRPPN